MTTDERVVIVTRDRAQRLDLRAIANRHWRLAQRHKRQADRTPPGRRRGNLVDRANGTLLTAAAYEAGDRLAPDELADAIVKLTAWFARDPADFAVMLARRLGKVPTDG